MKELIILAGKRTLLEAIKDHCREKLRMAKTENDVENYVMECLVLKHMNIGSFSRNRHQNRINGFSIFEDIKNDLRKLMSRR